MRTFLTLLLLTFPATAPAADLIPLHWKTSHASPPAQLSEQQKNLLPLIRLGIATLPEATVMQMTYLGGTALGLPPEDAQTLQSLLSARYETIANDPLFADATSALPYCYSVKKPEQGFASVYVPESANSESNVILFLHGYGGSFLFYQHYLAETFPDYIIICPAYGISCGNIPSEYLQESLDATSKELEFPIKTPVLIGLSAGGFGGFREYTERPTAYVGYICLAAYPPKDTLASIPRDGHIRLLAGGDEVFVKDNTLARAELAIKRRVADYSSQLIPGHDHFFLLTAEEKTKKIICGWVEEFQK